MVKYEAYPIEKGGGNPEKITVIAESAGALLSVYALASTKSDTIREALSCPPVSISVDMLACFSGMFYTTERDLIGLVYPRNIYGERFKDREFMEYMNPENTEVMDNLPHMLLTSSDADFLKHYTLRYEKALRRAGHSCELIYYNAGNKELTHAFPALKPHLPESGEILKRIVEKI